MTPLRSTQNTPGPDADRYFSAFDDARIWYAVSGPRVAASTAVGSAPESPSAEQTPLLPANADVLLLCSGGPGCSDYLAPVAAMVDDQLSVARFEQRGCGRSERKGPYVLATALADLEALRMHLGVTTWRVAGHSWGADLALAYALHFPKATQQVICISGGRIHHDRQWHQVYSRRRDETGELVPPADYPYNMQVNAQMNQSWKDFCKRDDLLARLAALQTPVHYILASEDIRPNWPLLQVAALLPQGSQQMIHGAQHSIWMTHAPQLRVALRTACNLDDRAEQP